MTDHPTSPPPPDATGEDLLRRAAAELRERPTPPWDGMAAVVRRQVRTTIRGGRTVGVGELPGGRWSVSEHVLVDLARRTVLSVPACTPLSVRSTISAGALTSVTADVSVVYGEDVRRRGEDVATALHRRLDPLTAGTLRVDVRVVDVTW